MTVRTVTIDTRDHGPVTIPEPAWCTGHHPHGAARSDICHVSEIETIAAASPRGPMELLSWSLTQWPYGLSAPGSDVHASVHFIDGDPEYDAAGLDTLAVDLLEAAGRVRQVARRLRAGDLGGDR